MRGGIDWEFGTDVHTLLYIKQITGEDLLYSMGNSTRYSVITKMGGELEKEWILVWVLLNLFLNTCNTSLLHCEATILKHKVKILCIYVYIYIYIY